MSGLYLLALIAVWLFLGWVIFRFWKLWQPTGLFGKTLSIGVGVLVFSVWFGGAFWQVTGKKMYWDARVREMCAQDGGVKVYETVELSEELLDWAGRIKIPDKSKAKPSDKYFKVRKITYYHKDDPQVTRRHTQIIRHSDGKVLGEYIRYGRGGGDLPGFWHSSSFSCTDITGSSKFESKVFIKRDNK